MSTAERKLSRREPPLPEQFYCKACRRYFQESDGSRAVHRRLFHQAVTQTTYYGEQEVHTFHRGPSGLFACLRCPFQHHDPRAFWDHVARQAGCPQTHAPNTDPTSLEELGVAVSELAGRLEPVLTGQEVGSVMERVEGTDRAEMAESLEAAQMDAEVAGTRTHLCQLEHVDTELVEAGEAVEVPETDVDVPCAREDMQTSPKLVPSNSHDSLDLSALAPLPSPLIPRPRSLPAIPAAHKPIASGTLHTAESSQPGDIPIVEDFSSPAIPSLDDWPSFDPTECEITPGPDTVTHDDDHDLERYNLVINTQLRLIICIPCSKAVLPARLRRHLLDKWPRLDVPDDIGEKLRSKYNVAATHDWPFPQARILPVFGLPILPNPYLFCQSCHHGYSSHTSLASHHYQRTCARSSDQSPGHFIAYGQTVGFDPRVVFPVDTSLLATPVRRPAFSTEPFTTLPRPDYAHLPISNPSTHATSTYSSKTKTFIHSSGRLPPNRSISPSIAPPTRPSRSSCLRTSTSFLARTASQSKPQ
ncbi:unnamed protein product [Mycena citricolor]|uniref:Uncharacterized protein n=1 Tax=Mycena citricolor TaxID=2018698 RepID=A0AAD2HL77_9AGAR|nr:unnamed protein product [Mycena citricolor]